MCAAVTALTQPDVRIELLLHRRRTLSGYTKRRTGVATLTWPESVDEALCVGWIDGVRHRIDERRYQIRFSPRQGQHAPCLVRTDQSGPAA